MKYKTITLMLPNGNTLAECNTFPNVVELWDAIEDAQDSAELEKSLSKLLFGNVQIKLDRERDEYVRFKINDYLNTEYLIIGKE